MNILVIDAQGGGIGKQLVARIKREYPTETVTAVGTNSIATAAMIKAGADMINDGFLGFAVVALALVIWTVIVLVSDPRGTVKAAITKR